MWTLALRCSLALAAPAPAPAEESRAESTHDRWTSMTDLAVEPALIRRVERPVRLELGPELLELEGGWLTPVFGGHLRGEWERDAARWLARQEEGEVPRLPSPDEQGDHLLVGFVWSGGAGRITARLDDRADAPILANRMVLDLGLDRATWAPVAARQAPLVVAVDDVIVLGVDPAIAAVYLGDRPDPYEIVVWGDTEAARHAGRRAKQVFGARVAVWDLLGIDAGGRLAWDRLGRERGVAAAEGSFTLWEALTDQRFGLVAPQLGGEVDRWLAVIRDTTGELDPRRELRITSLGASAGAAVDGLVGGVPHPPSVEGDPTSAPLPRARVEGVSAESVVTAVLTGNELDLAVTVESLLRLRAVGAPAPWIDLTLPKMDEIPGSFAIVTAELKDGTPLLGRDEEDLRGRRRTSPDPEPWTPPGVGRAPVAENTPQPVPGPGETHLRLQLPTPLAPGEEVVVRLKHVDTWPLALLAFDAAFGGWVSVGQTSGVQGFLPSVRPARFGAPWTFSVRVGVPADSGLVAMASGLTVEEGDGGGWRMVRAWSEGHRAHWPAVVVGRYQTADEPVRRGQPSVRVRALDSHFAHLGRYAAEARRMMDFYEGFLPRYPLGELELFEAPPQDDGLVWIAPHGMFNLHNQSTKRGVGYTPNDEPHLEAAVLSHELAHQYWGHLAPPATGEDFWIAESFAELYGCLYLAERFGPRHCEGRMDAKREVWESPAAPLPASLSRSWGAGAEPSVLYDYGAYVLGRMLVPRIGAEAFFSALDVMLREHPFEPVTTERIQVYLELSSDRELDTFFDVWVHGGHAPRLSLEWASKGGVVSGTVRSDLPFGTFDVPVVVTSAGRARDRARVAEALVTVTDGEGTFTLDAGTVEVEVLLDPEGWVVARSRSVARLRD